MVWLSDTWWPGLMIWTLLYISDYYMTLTCARLYTAGVQERLVFEGSYEITPYYQQDIDQLRRFSPRFVRALLQTVLMLLLTWWLGKQLGMPGLYAFILGFCIVVELAVHQRHLQNLFLFRAITRPGAVYGRIQYSRGLTLRLSAVNLLTFAGTFAILALFTKSLFVLGGAVACVSVASKHWQLARHHVATAPEA